jgi:hypothetical protein
MSLQKFNLVPSSPGGSANVILTALLATAATVRVSKVAIANIDFVFVFIAKF